MSFDHDYNCMDNCMDNPSRIALLAVGSVYFLKINCTGRITNKSLFLLMMFITLI